MTTWLAAAVTTGSGLNCRAGGVVMLNAEDDPEDTIRPRLEAAGADLDRVWIEPNVSLDPNMISVACEQVGGACLITIDPVQAFLPGHVNSWKGQDVRIAPEPLRAFASDCGGRGAPRAAPQPLRGRGRPVGADR